jgi:hypothetical protein
MTLLPCVEADFKARNFVAGAINSAGAILALTSDINKLPNYCGAYPARRSTAMRPSSRSKPDHHETRRR